MEDESLEKALEVCIKHLDEANINKYDKVEIMINLSKFLSPKTYDKNIKTLNKKRN